jgi:transposase
MKQKIEKQKLRKKTIKLLLSGKPVKEICEIIGLSRQWVYKWYKRYLKGDKLWFKEHSRAPHRVFLIKRRLI